MADKNKLLNSADLLSVYIQDHIQLLCESYRQLTGKLLLTRLNAEESVAEALHDAEFALLSHGTEADPILNYGNRTAQRLFDMNWQELIKLPSRQTAEPIHRAERHQLLERVTLNGYIDDYSGIRISASNRRFRIEKAIVWSLEYQGRYHGQAAMFRDWTWL